MIDFIREQLKHNPFFLTAFIGGSVSIIVLFFKNFGRELYQALRRRIVFSCAIYQNDPLFSDFEIWFYAHYGEKYRNVEASVNEKSDHPHYPGERGNGTTKIYFKQSEGVFFIKYQGKYILVRKGKEKMEHAVDARSFFFNQYHFFAVQGAKHVRLMLEECVAFSARKSQENELRICVHNNYGDWMASSKISSKNIDSVVIAPSAMSALKTDMDTFMSAKEQYDRRHIFYKRGYCFYGEPGNGKTSLALAMASYFRKDIYTLDLNSIGDNGALKNLFMNIGSNAVLLIEDIDCFFHLREPVKKDSKISFSTFLNCVDGIHYKEGLVIVITTNKKEALDPALVRAGRIDFMMEVPKPAAAEINRYLQIFYEKDAAFAPVSHNPGLSMCDIQELCLNHESAEACAGEIMNRTSIKKVA
jgi:hypothetical protein